MSLQPDGRDDTGRSIHSVHLNLRVASIAVQFLAIAAGASFLDAVAGRLLHAHLDPSGAILGSGAFLLVRRVLDVPGPGIGAVWGMAFAATYLACFNGAAEMLVGWNQSLPWTLTNQVQITSVLAGIVGGSIGARPTASAAPPHGDSNALTG